MGRVGARPKCPKLESSGASSGEAAGGKATMAASGYIIAASGRTIFPATQLLDDELQAAA